MRNGLMNSVMTCTNTPWSENEVTCEHYGKFEANVDRLMTVLNFILIGYLFWKIYTFVYKLISLMFRYGRYHSHLMLFWLINKLRGFSIWLPSILLICIESKPL